MATNTTGTSCLGPLAGLQAQQKLYAGHGRRPSADPAATTLVLVSRPEAAALREAERTSGELAELGVRNQHLVINGVFTATDPTRPGRRRDGTARPRPLCGDARRPGAPARGRRSRSRRTGLLGIDGAARRSPPGRDRRHRPGRRALRAGRCPPLAELIDELARTGHGVILTMGKGGVGKTTVAAAIAVALADRGLPGPPDDHRPGGPRRRRGQRRGAEPDRVSRIDPRAETAAYTAEVMATAGKDLDAQGQALLEEDLRSPCTEEIAVFRAFARGRRRGRGRLRRPRHGPDRPHDPAARRGPGLSPRGDPAGERDARGGRELLPRLRDPDFTRVLIVTLPEATPVHEAAKLQGDLMRAGIAPFAWVINQSLTPLAVTDPVLVSRRAHEARYIREVVTEHARRAALVPWQVEPPIGRGPLLALTTRPAEKELVPA